MEELARSAASQFPAVSGTPAVRLAHESYNSIFRVETPDQQAWALRVGDLQRLHPDGTELVEAQWMQALHADTDAGVAVPQVYDGPNGVPYVHQEQRRCMLFDWIDGVVAAEAMSRATAHQMGRLAALLHQHAATTLPDPAAEILVADKVLYWLVDDRLDEVASREPVIGEALDRAQACVAALWADPPHPPHLLHGDFTANNVICRGDELVVIDFQDLIWGFDVQDLAISLLSFGRFDDADDLREQFRQGYASVRPWPDLDPAALAALDAARRLHQLNMGLNLRRPGLDAFVSRAVGLIRDSLG